jgi:hypothetical protein
MHTVEDDDTTPPADWSETLPDGQFHLSILLSGDTRYPPVKALVAALPRLFAEVLPPGLKVGLCIVDELCDAEIPILDEPCICSVPAPSHHCEP